MTRIEDQTFLDTKDREGERNSKRGNESERASGTNVERENAVEPRCFSERTEKVISIGPTRGVRGKGTDRKREEEGERRSKEWEKDRERYREVKKEGRGPDGSERDGVNQPEECLSWQRRGSGTGSV